MSHEVETMFSVGRPAWHGLGHVPLTHPDRETAIKLAGHDFTIIEAPIITAPIRLDNGEISTSHQDGRFKAQIRSDNGHLLSIVKKTFTPIQPVVLWDTIDALVGLPNVQYETAGVLRKGENLWVLAKIDEPLEIPGDPSPLFPYVLVTSYNDGRGGFTGRRVLERVVCRNTLSAAEYESNQSGRVFTFAHRGDVMARIEQAREVLNGVRADVAAQAAELRELCGISIDERRREIFLAKFVPAPAAKVVSDRVLANVEETRQTIRNILDSPTCEGIRENGYGLFQATVEYLDHFRKAHNKETAFRRNLLEPKPFKERAAAWIRELETV